MEGDSVVESADRLVAHLTVAMTLGSYAEAPTVPSTACSGPL